MNLSQIRSLTRTYLNEATAAFWTDAELNDVINVGCRKVHNLIKSLNRHHYTTRATFSTVSGTEWYNLPSDLKSLRIVSREDSDGVEVRLTKAHMPDPFAWVGTYQFDTTVSSSTALYAPVQFLQLGNDIRLIPIPQSAVTMRLYYEARFVSLSADADTPTFDEDYHDMAAKWAAVEASVKNDADRKRLADMFNERKNDLIQDMQLHTPSPHTETEGYLQELW